MDNTIITSGDDTPGPTPEEIDRALDIARDLVKAGVPVFVAPPADNAIGFKLPPKWETSTPTLDVVNRWRPGWALAAVCGHAVDVLDVDPRNGGDAGAAGLKQAGMWPNTYGQAATPSGGTHDLVAPLKAGKGVPAEGVDLQGGKEDGTGRGFVFIAPTVRVSKVDGVPRPYRWIVEPDLDRLAESAATDDTGAALAERLRRCDRKTEPTSTLATGAGDLFPAASPFQPERAFTQAEAQAFVLTHGLTDLVNAPTGTINNRANTAAVALSHFVPEFWSADQAYGILCNALAKTAYDGKTWRAERFRSILDGTEQVRDQWKATKREEFFSADTMDTTGQGGLTGPPVPAPKARLRAALLKRSELGKLPVPVPLIEDVMHRETIVVLAGKFGSYKSFVTVAMGCSLAAGVPWMGHEVPEAVPVLYVAAEGAYGIRKRVEAWESAYGPVPDSFHLLPVPVRLLVPADIVEADELIAELGIKVLIVDTLHASAPGADENNSKEIGPLYDTLRALRERHGLTTILVHHTGHAGERSRGSSSIEDDADTAFVIKMDGEGRDAGTQRTLEHRKSKDGALLDPVPLRLTLVPGTDSGYAESGTVEPQPSPNYLPDGVAALAVIKMLDELRVPRDAGRDLCRKALGTRIKASNDLLAEAIRRRKAGEGGQ